LPSTRNKFQARLLAIDDDPGFLSFLRDALERTDLELTTTSDPEHAIELFRELRPQVVLSDMVMPGLSGMEVLEAIVAIEPSADVILLTGQYTPEAAVEAIEKGASDFIAKPVPVQTLRDRVYKLIEEARQRFRSSDLEDQLLASHTFHGIIGRSSAIEEVFRRISRIAPHYQTALITGPSGSGKELVARALREMSPAASGPFVIVNCAAIVETLFESELFGHVKGSFTGASGDKVGMFEAAHQGTLFLDEVEELSPSGQAKLLRVLQERQVQRVGATAAKQVDVRVIAATNRDLRKMVEDKKFREDLFYRIAMVEVRVPSLSDRPEDIELLVQHFIRVYSERFKKNVVGLSRSAQTAMLRYGWPGNIRELENAIGNGVMMSDRNILDIQHLPDEIRNSSPARLTLVPGIQQFVPDPNWTLEELERRYIEYVLELEDGNVPRAAERLGVPRSTLYSRLKNIKQNS
jgi:DNA-binding NtrC family response regulator